MSEQLTGIFSSIQERRGRGARLTEQAAGHSRMLAQAVGGVIMSLQGGDSARQRLEHVHDAAQILDHILATPVEDEDALVVDLLRRVLAGLLDDATNELGRDLANIVESLNRLSKDTERLVELGRGLYGGADDSGSSFLDVLQTKLSAALVLIQKCDGARGSVDRVTFALGDMLKQFETTVRSLNDIIFDILLIGVNAGLKANRLGPDGRGLVVIAQELKDIAKLISDDAEKLMPVIVLIQETAGGLDRKQLHGVNRIGAIDQTLRAAVDRLRDGNLRLGGVLARLVEDGVNFGDILCNAQDDISVSDTTNENVCVAADALREAAVARRQPASEEEAGRARNAVNEFVRASYTMEAERRIHDFIVGNVNQVDMEHDAA